MSNYALIAAIGADAVEAVHGYRVAVLAEAERRQICLVAETCADSAVGSGLADAEEIDIRMAFVHCRGRPDLAGRTLQWEAEQGWSMSHRLANRPLCYYAGPAAGSLQLVPTPLELLDWAVAEPTGTACPPVGLRLNDEAGAIDRLMTFVEPDRRLATKAASRRTDGEE